MGGEKENENSTNVLYAFAIALQERNLWDITGLRFVCLLCNIVSKAKYVMGCLQWELMMEEG